MIICTRCWLFVLRCSLIEALAGVLLIVAQESGESCRLQVVSCRLWGRCWLLVGDCREGWWCFGGNTGVLHCVQDDGLRGQVDDDFRKRLRWVGFDLVGGVFDFDGATGGCDVGVGFGDRGPGLFVDFANHLLGAAEDAQSASVRGGEAQTFVESVGALLGDASGGERVDDGGDGNLDGLAVLHGGELEEGIVGDEAGLEVGLVAVEVVAAVEAAVEVAEDRTVEGDSVALQTVGLDVAAKIDFHGQIPFWVVPPRGVVAKS